MEETDELWPGPRRVPTPLLLGLAVLAALVVFFVAAVRGEWAMVGDVVEAASPAVPSSTVPQPLPGPSGVQPVTPAAAQSRGLPAAARVAGAASAPAVAAAVCGMPGLPLDAHGLLADRTAALAPVRAARAQLLALLTASADTTERAAGLYLSARPSRLDATAARGEGASTPAPAPVDNAAAVAALATLAVSTASPQVYAWALDACDARRVGACQLLSTAQWARLDAGNTAPWMRRLAEAQRTRDVGGGLEALHQLSLARFTDTRTRAAAQVALRRLPADTPLYVKTMVSMDLLGRASGDAADGGPLAASCGDAAVRDSNRRQTCAAIAEVLTQRGRSVADLAAGTRLGERVGWPAARVQALDDEHDALMQRQDDAFKADPAGPGFADCGVMTRLQRTLESFATDGELPTLRRALAASGDDVAVLARRYRDQRSASVSEGIAAARR